MQLQKLRFVTQRFDSTVPGGGGYCWMMSHFHDWIDYNGVTFLAELLEWGRTFSGFLGKENSGKQGFKDRKIPG